MKSDVGNWNWSLFLKNYYWYLKTEFNRPIRSPRWVECIINFLMVAMHRICRAAETYQCVGLHCACVEFCRTDAFTSKIKVTQVSECDLPSHANQIWEVNKWSEEWGAWCNCSLRHACPSELISPTILLVSLHLIHSSPTQTHRFITHPSTHPFILEQECHTHPHSTTCDS